MERSEQNCDVLIVGAGPAGLTAGMRDQAQLYGAEIRRDCIDVLRQDQDRASTR